MKVRIWLIVKDGEPRVYPQAHAPTSERIGKLRAEGYEVGVYDLDWPQAHEAIDCGVAYRTSVDLHSEMP